MEFEITRDMIVVENDDPRVTYSHGWERVSAESKLCTGGSFHRAYCKGASARFEFEGLHIWVVGHKSASHGNIKINIDGQPGIATINAWGGARELVPFRNLFEHEFAEPGPHWIEVVNDLGGSEITIDAFAYRPMPPGRVWQAPRGLKLATITDTDPRVEYSGSWHQLIDEINDTHLGNGSCHHTRTRNATISILVESAHFWIIGDMDSNHGRYSVSVDGGMFETFSGRTPEWRKFAILYERRFVDPGPHCVVIRNEDDEGLTLDAVIYEPPMQRNAGAEPGTRLSGREGEQTEGVA